MNGYMATGALAAVLETQAGMRHPGLCVESGVALQAELPPFTPHQQHAIGAAMGIVADDATRNPHGRVFINKGATLLHVALNAGLPIGFLQAGPADATVSVVTIRTLQHLFGNAVVDGQGKLRLDVAMTGKA